MNKVQRHLLQGITTLALVACAEGAVNKDSIVGSSWPGYAFMYGLGTALLIADEKTNN